MRRSSACSLPDPPPAVVRRVVSGDEPKLTGKAVAVLFVTGTLGRWATPLGLLFTGGSGAVLSGARLQCAVDASGMWLVDTACTT